MRSGLGSALGCVLLAAVSASAGEPPPRSQLDPTRELRMEDHVYGVAATDSGVVVAGDCDGVIRLWGSGAAPLRELHTPPTSHGLHPGDTRNCVRGMVLDPGGQWLAVRAADDSAYVFDLTTDAPPRALKLADASPLALTPEGAVCAVAADGQLTAWDPGDLQVRWRVPLPAPGRLVDLTFPAPDQVLLSLGVPLPNSPFAGPQGSPALARLALGDGETLWRWEGSEHPFSLDGLGYVATLPDGAAVAVGGGAFRRFQGAGLAAETALRGYEVNDVLVDPGGEFALTAEYTIYRHQGRIGIWRLPSLERVTEFGAHRFVVDRLAWTPSGDLLSGGGDILVRVWSREALESLLAR